MVGKSAITCRYVFKKFVREYTATIEDIYTKRVTVDEEPAEIDILDTAGLQEFRAVKMGKLREKEGFLVVFDVSDKDTFNRIDEIYNSIYEQHSNKDVSIILVGNKID